MKLFVSLFLTFRVAEISPMRIFCPGKISPVRIFTEAKYQQNEITLLWMRNSAEMAAKFCLVQRKFAGTSTKLRRELSSSTKDEMRRISP